MHVKTKKDEHEFNEQTAFGVNDDAPTRWGGGGSRYVCAKPWLVIPGDLLYSYFCSKYKLYDIEFHCDL